MNFNENFLIKEKKNVDRFVSILPFHFLKKMNDKSFADLLQQAEMRRTAKQNKKGKNAQQNNQVGPTSQISIHVPAKKLPTEFNFSTECGCFGTEHPAINNCMNCGRVICKAEGERPCPYCGTPVFSDETLEDPERMQYLINQFELNAQKTGWVPACDKDFTKSVPAPRTDTKMFDLETDWFSNEIAQIYGLEPEDEEEEEENDGDNQEGPIFSDDEDIQIDSKTEKVEK